MDKKVIQIRLTELELPVRGPSDDEEDINLFRFILSYPAEGITSIETVKTVSVKKDIPTSWSDFDKAIVFKTEIRGQAKLSVEAVSVDKSSKADEFFKSFFKTLFGTVLGIWTGGFGSAYVGAITKTVGTSLADMVEDEEDIDVLGKASITLSSENLLGEISLPFKVEKPVVKKVRQTAGTVGPRSRRRVRVEQEPLLAAGDSNGKVKMIIEVLN